MENKKKRITGYLVSVGAEGMRCMYSYSEIDDKGELINNNARGTVYLMGEQEKQSQEIIEFLNKRLNE